MKRFARLRAVGAAVGIAVVVTAASAGSAQPSASKTPLDKVDHIVVIYEENHSFDNLYGGWEGVNGRANADRGQDDAGRPGRASRTPA